MPSSMKPYKTITLRLDAAHYARLTETARTTLFKELSRHHNTC